VGVRRADDQHEIAVTGDCPDGQLAVLGGVADVVAGRVEQPGEALAELADDGCGLLDRQRGLGQPRDLGGVADLKMRHVAWTADQVQVRGCLAGRSDDLVVSGLADEHNVVIAGGEAPGLVMHLSDQRTGGVDGPQVPAGGFLADSGGDTVSREDGDRAFWHLADFVDEDRAPVLQRGHHVLVVDDLPAHVNRGAVPLQCRLHGGHSAVDARAPAMGGRQKDPAGRLPPAARIRRTGRADLAVTHVHFTPGADAEPLIGAYALAARPVHLRLPQVRAE
jgi:hypothetical protein